MALTRREYLKVVGSSVAGAAVAWSGRTSAVAQRQQTEAVRGADPRVKGLFLIPSTPFTSSGAVDYDDLVREAKFMNWCGVDGLVWPQAGDAVDLLTRDEKM